MFGSGGDSNKPGGGGFSFGSSASTSSGSSKPAGFAAFGSTDKPSGFGSFGTSATSGTTATGFGGFGAAKTGGTAGANPEAPKTGFSFGPSGSAASTGTSIFGSGVNKTAAAPAFPKFGSTESNASASASASGSVFGTSVLTTAATSTAPAVPAFGGISTSTGGPLFGAKAPAGTDTPKSTGEAPKPGIFGSSSFAASKPASEGSSNISTASTKPATPAFGGFSLGGSSSSTTATTTTNTLTSAATGSTPAFGGFKLGGTPAAAATTTTAAATSTPAFGGFKLGGSASATTTSAAATPTPAFGGFKLAGASASTSTTAAESKPEMLCFFGSRAPTTENAASEAKAATSTTAGPTSGTGLGGFKLSTAPAVSTGGDSSGSEKKSSIFGGSATTATGAPAAASTTAGSGSGTATNAGGGAAAATAENPSDKPTTIANAALRGKTLEEIVQLWTTELAAQTRSFHAQANTVSYWDRALVQQGKRITELYEATMGVEAEQAVLEQSLDHMEGQQNALQNLLDAYEGRLQDIAKKTSTRPAGGRGATLTADEERDQVYSSAERLNTQLDELARRLTGLVEDVNSISSADPSTAGAEGEGQHAAPDPFAQIVQILNAQLTSLEWIDSQTAHLQERVKTVQRVHQEVATAQASISGTYGAGDLLGESGYGGRLGAAARNASPSLTIPGGFSSDPPPPVTSSFGTPVSTLRKPAGSSLLGRGGSGAGTASPFASTPLRRNI